MIGKLDVPDADSDANGRPCAAVGSASMTPASATAYRQKNSGTGGAQLSAMVFRVFGSPDLNFTAMPKRSGKIR